MTITVIEKAKELCPYALCIRAGELENRIRRRR